MEWVADWKDVTEFGKVGKELEFVTCCYDSGRTYDGCPYFFGTYSGTSHSFHMYNWCDFPGLGFNSQMDTTYKACQTKKRTHPSVTDGILLFCNNTGNVKMPPFVANSTSDSATWRVYDRSADPPSSYCYSPSIGGYTSWPKNWTFNDMNNCGDMYDKRWDDIVDWPIQIGFVNQISPCLSTGCVTHIPLLRATSGSGKLKFMFQCDYPKYDSANGYYKISQNFTDNKADSYFGLHDSNGNLKEKIPYPFVPSHGGFWNRNYNDGWVTTGEVDVIAGDMIVCSLTWNYAGVNQGGWGRLIMNYVNLNP